MRLINFHAKSVGINFICLLITVFFYIFKFGLDAEIIKWLYGSIFSAIASYVTTDYFVNSNLPSSEHHDSMIKPTDIEKKMAGVVFLLPSTLAILFIIAVTSMSDPLSKVGWILIPFSINIGKSLNDIYHIIKNKQK